MTLDHKTGISIALAITLIGAAGSFLVVRSQVQDLRGSVFSMQQDVSEVKEDVAFMRGRLELMSKVTSR